MKTLLPMLILLLFASSATAQDTPWDARLPFETGVIKYTVGGTMSGEKTVYIKDFGQTTAEYTDTTMKMFGMSQPQKEIIITTPDWIYTIDQVENTAVKQANPNKFMIEEFNSLSRADRKKVIENADQLGVSTIEGMDGAIEKNARDILGYPCDKVSMTGTTAFLFSGTQLPLQISGDMMGVKVEQTAVEVSKGKVAASKFEVPSNLSIEHDPGMDQMMKERARSVVQALVRGESPVMTQGSDSMPGQTSPGMDQMTPEMQEQMKKMMEMMGNQNG